MTKKRVVTVGFQIAGSNVTYEQFSSRLSLLDYDIICFRPNPKIHAAGLYRGKPHLNEHNSFQFKESCQHWRREIKEAVESGKTVLVFLAPFTELYVDTGNREFSGTGRNQKTTELVELIDNYKSLPLKLKIVTTSGKSIKLLTKKFSSPLTEYWKALENDSQFRITIDEPDGDPCLVTRNGEKTVGTICRSKTSLGTLLLLPDIEFDRDNFTEEIGSEEFWTDAAKTFSSRFLEAIIGLDLELRSSSEVTPQPNWAESEDFKFSKERKIFSDLVDNEIIIEEAQKKKEKLTEDLKDAGSFRALLYEKGRPLESTVIHALTVLGFRASNYKDGESEFDAVFESPEGRLLGEAEGKDNKAVNIDKLRQLALNIHEDLAREDIKSPAKSVLFGNAFRLLPLDQRGEPFTDKCVSGATTSSTALVFTPDLFKVIRYLVENENLEYAKECRKILTTTIGRVIFPKLPLPK
jgi:hypothetical protein